MGDIYVQKEANMELKKRFLKPNFSWPCVSMERDIDYWSSIFYGTHMVNFHYSTYGRYFLDLLL